MKEKYLVDVPVAIYVFIRPESLKKVFDVIREARPSTLFLMSDGPRDYVESDKINIQKSRDIVENIDWECNVHRIYMDKNIGMYEMGKKTKEYIFNTVDRCIFLEDDLVPSVSFFKFCEELLEKYKGDLRVHRICGTNSLNVYDKPNSDYFFSKEGSIWGYAIWKRTYELFDYNHEYGKDKYIMDRLKENAHPTWYNRELNYSLYGKSDGHIAGAEFFFQTTVDLHNSLNIVPTKNMICNIGVTEGSTNSSNNINKLAKGIQKLFNSQTYEYNFPLKHPRYVIEDKEYYKKVNRIFGLGYKWVLIYRKIETTIRYIIYGDFKGIKYKIKKNLKERKNI